MNTIKLIARHGEAVRHAIELGDIVHMHTASAELTDAFLLCAISSGLLHGWAGAFPDPRQEADLGMDVLVAASVAARFAGLSALRKLDFVWQSARVLGALGSSVEVTPAGTGMSRRGTSDEPVVSGDVLRTLLVPMDMRVQVSPAALACAVVDTRVGRVRQRGSRRAAQGQVDARDAQARGRRVAEQLLEWSTDGVGPSLEASAQLGDGRRRPIVDCTKVEVPLDSSHDAWSGRVKNADGSWSRGYTLATLRTRLDTAGVCTQAAVAPMQDHDIAVCRPMLTTTPALRAGARLLEDHGCMDGDLISVLKQQRQVDVIVPLRSTMVACDDAVRWAEMAGQRQRHPSRAKQQIAFVPGVEHVWETCRVPRNAWVMRSWHAKKHRHASMVLVTTDQERTATGIVNHDEQRPEMEHDDAQMQSGGWK